MAQWMRGEQWLLFLLTLVKVFGTISCKNLMEKLMKYRLGKWTLRWIKNWLNVQAQKVVISGKKCSRRPVTSGVSQGQILAPTLFNIFIMTWMRQSAPSASFQVMQNQEEQLIHQRFVSPSRGTWTGQRNGLMKFNRGKCLIRPLKMTNPMHQDRLGLTIWKTGLQKRIWVS